VIVAGDGDDAAVARSAGCVAVFERIAGAVHAGPLAVPHAEHAVVARAREQVRLLRAPDRRCREVFVQARLKANLRGVEVFRRAPQLAIEAAERRAAVAGNEAGRVPPRETVEETLREQQAD
jgi:hypothetical protein